MNVRHHVEIDQNPDADLIAYILLHDDIFEAASDDASEKPADDDFVPLAALNSFAFYVVKIDGELAGMFMFQKHNHVLWEVHTAIFSKFRGSGAVQAAIAVAGSVFACTSCKKIMTMVPSTNRPAMLFARIVGMRAIGVLSKSFLKNGTLVDQTILELSEDDVCQQSQ